MKSSKLFAKSRTIRLLIGCIMIVMILPGAVTAIQAGGVVPVAQFTASVIEGQSPLVVQFTDQSLSIGKTSYAWDIDNDGIVDYTKKHPSHTYQEPGIYTVILTVTNEFGSDTETRTGYVTVSSTALKAQPTNQAISTQRGLPTAQFTASPTGGPVPLTVQFTDKSVSSGKTSYKWEFGDGSFASVQNPSHTYQNMGTYSVTLTVTNAKGSDSEIKDQYISVVIPTPTPIPTQGGDCYGAEACNPTGNPIGGGVGYSRIFIGTEPSVKYIVSTKEQLADALGRAQPGEVVFVSGNAVIDLTNELPIIAIPAGVILASNRGENGAKGALIKKRAHTPGFIGSPDINGWYTSSWEEPMFYAMGKDVRITGLQLEGEMYPQDYGNQKRQTYESDYLVGIFANAKSGFEVDNNEIRGWAWSGISMKNCPDAYVHHNYIHSNQARGEGYGSNLYGGNALFEANKYDYNRHAITGAGLAGEKYEARYNIVMGNGDAIGGHHFDVHQDEDGGLFAGDTYLIHHNTFEDGVGINGGKLASIAIRQRPTTGMYIDHNLFETISTETEGGKPIWERDSTEHMNATNNLWMGKFYPDNDGIVWFM
jgi:PKD repeat protein